MMKVIQVIEIAGLTKAESAERLPRELPDKPLYLKDFFETACGRGYATFTQDSTEAKQFINAAEAIHFYHQQSVLVPYRNDGRPNRPLTAYTVEICDAVTVH